MATTIQIKKSVYGASAGAPSSLLYGELAWDNTAGKLYIGKQTGSSTVTVTDLEVTVPDASDSVKGKASFSTNNFVVNSGAVQIKDLGVATAELQNDAVTGAKIADDAINSEHYTDGSIDTAHIADLNVTTAKIAADAITGAKVADDAIGSEHIANDAVTQALIADNITLAGNCGSTGNWTVGGDLIVNGSTTTLDTTNTNVKDSLMQLNAGASTNANDCGLIIERGSTGDNATIFWDESADKWTLGLTTDTADSTGNMSNFTKGTLVANLDTTTITNATIDCGTYAN